jgi:hypothetical protein
MPGYSFQVPTPLVSANIGDAKPGFQTADHNGWIKLDGRLKTTLTTTQQANATALGIGANLPDATGRVFVQGTIGALIGSSSITQANLPNISLTASSVSAGTPSGTVSLNTHGATGDGFDPSPASGVTNLQITDRTPENSTVLGVTMGGGFSGSALPTHNHTVALGGSGTAYTPAAIGINQFLFLGL